MSDTLSTLAARLALLDGAEAIRAALAAVPGQVAVLSSFGAEAAVLLDLVAQVDPATPVLTVDTGCLFPETIAYRQDITQRLGLTNLRILRPTATEIEAADPTGGLWYTNPDACCQARKVVPLGRAVAGFTVLIDGRKRAHGGQRDTLATAEVAGSVVKLSPLANWSSEDIAESLERSGLPPHPLVAKSYRSIGCSPCTSPVPVDAPVRSGRWSGQAKTECGLHTAVWTWTP